MPKQFPELPVGDEFFPQLLPWALKQQRYTNEEARAFCAAAFGVPKSTLENLRFVDSKTPAWNNYVAHALKLMTERRLHIPPSQNDGVHYVVDTNAILKYLADKGFDHTAALVEEPLITFRQRARFMPTTTEAERLVIQRIGQDIFREALIDQWGCCLVTEIDDPALLRASHIKKWSSCESDSERLDINNGLLLAAHVDAAFDAGLISFNRRGRIQFSPGLSEDNRRRLGIAPQTRIWLSPASNRYMAWHRANFGFPETG